MHGVAAAVGAWLDAGVDPVVVRVPLAEGIGGAGPGEVLAFGPAGQRVGGVLGGALGSRRTQGKRMDRLIAAGATADELDAVRGPAGLDLGGTTAGEVALAICAEVLAVRNGRPPLSLQATSGPIHQ